MHRLCSSGFTLAGCSAEPNIISGTVTLDGTLVTKANLILIDPDGNEHVVPISPAGKYVLQDPPLGNVRVKVVSLTDSIAATSPVPPSSDLTASPSDRGPKMTTPTRVIVPDRYGDADNGLTMQIKKGRAPVNDINLAK